ncbi:2,3-bisphosphoglycerate-independent phosphoglycerate mutase [Candidatus Auribacterota bacterium]
MTQRKPLVLIIRDGWGIPVPGEKSAILAENTPCFEKILSEYPWAPMSCSGNAVGLPEGQMGNSEVGHLNIGAGRVVYQDFTRISKAIEEGSFFENEELNKAVEQALEKKGALHLIGLCSDGGVHSHLDHLYALVSLAKQKGLEKVYFHALLDGRDTPPESGATYLAEVEKKFKEIGVGKIVTVMGRYYAMDRDNRWDRVEKAYQAMAYRQGVEAKDAVTAVSDSYKNQVTDEFVLPVVIRDETDDESLKITNDDTIIFFNFRADRAREITRTFIDRDFNAFNRENDLFPYYVCLTEYDETFSVPIIFPSVVLKNIFPEIISKAGLKQLRIAETEKYAHVTFFFSGGVEEAVLNEDRALIPSPKVATYDLKPEMSAYEVTEEMIKRIDSDQYDVIILNYANADMVGHTGIHEAAYQAIKVVDECVGRIVDKVKEVGGISLITADHGNSEKMKDKNGESFTAHTTGKVHFVLVDDERKNVTVKEGILADIAPTMLYLLGIEPSAEMTGKNLIEE